MVTPSAVRRQAKRDNAESLAAGVFETPTNEAAQTPWSHRARKSLRTGLTESSNSSSVQSAELVLWKEKTQQATKAYRQDDLSHLCGSLMEDKENELASMLTEPFRNGKHGAGWQAPREKPVQRRRNVLKPLEGILKRAGVDEFSEDCFGDEALAEIEDFMSKIEAEHQASFEKGDPYGGGIDWEAVSLDEADSDGWRLFGPSERYDGLCRLRIIEAVVDAGREQRLVAVETAASSPRTIRLTLRDEWADPPLRPGDLLHVLSIGQLIGDHDRSDDVFARLCEAAGVVNSSSPFVIIAHPDVFVSPTRVSDATACERKALLGHLLGSARSLSRALVIGSFKHELFGAVIPSRARFASAVLARDAVVRDVVDRGAPKLYGLGIDSTADVVRDCRAFVDGLLDHWAPKYFWQYEDGHGGGFVPPSSGGQDGRALSIRGVTAVENAVWSPLLGVSGNVDAAVEVGELADKSCHSSGCSTTSKRQCVVMPLELKSGREHLAHSAQVALYVAVDRANGLLGQRCSEEQANVPKLGGLLLYASVDNRDNGKTSGERTRMRHVNVSAAETRSIFAARNRLAGALSYFEASAAKEEAEHAAGRQASAPTLVLPGPLRNRNECRRCFSLATCALHHCAAEGGDAESFGCGEDVWRRALSGRRRDGSSDHAPEVEGPLMSAADRAYYNSWMAVLALEAAQSTPAVRLLLSQSGTEREARGEPCVTGLRVDRTAPPTSELNLVRPERMASAPSSRRLELGDFVLVSVERGLGTTRRIAPIGRGVVTIIEQQCDGMLVINVRSESPIDAPEDSSIRVDKDETHSCIVKARNNVTSLFVDLADHARYDESDSAAGPRVIVERRAARAERRRSLRSLVVELRAPRFDEGVAEAALEMGFSRSESATRWGGQGCRVDALVASWARLNKEQRAAARHALAAVEYALVLGMPGTGKTSTIEWLIRCLVALGKRVLVCSYTHAAVDHLLSKLLDQGVSERNMARLAPGSSIDKVDPRIRPLCVEAESSDSNRLGTLRTRLGRARIVGCTCLAAAADPLLARFPEFDVAVVDEAGQISQPVALAPLFEARSFVLVGDPQQLAPLSRSRLAQARGASVSLFERLADANPAAVAILASQYRMNAAVMDLANTALADEFDGRRLACGSAEVANAKLQVDWSRCPSTSTTLLAKALAAPVAFLDMPSDVSNCSQTRNDAEADIIAHLVHGLIALGVHSAQIAVITPFRDQLKALSDRLRSVGCLLSTIDRFQGRDASCVLLSLVKRAPPLGDLLSDAKRVNVALSRAKHQIILVGSAKVLAENSPVFARLVAKTRRDEHLHVVRDIPRDFLPTCESSAKADSLTVHRMSWQPSRLQHPVLADVLAEIQPSK